MSKVIAWFSCGAASAVATKMALAKYSEVEIRRCIVIEEHPDNERFSADCEKWFGQPVLRYGNAEYKNSVFEVIRRRNYTNGPGGAPCSMLLKKQPRKWHEKAGDINVYGFTYDEEARYDRFLDANNHTTSEVPLIDAKISHAGCLAIIQRAGLELPVMYKLGFEHNNCIGCVKAEGAGYWNKVRKHFPDRFQKMAEVSRSIGSKMVVVKGQRMFLDELPPGIGNYQDEAKISCDVFCEQVARVL